MIIKIYRRIKNRNIKPVIAHYKGQYLNITETFIYQYLVKFEKFKVIFLTRETKNLESFPFKELYSSSNIKNYLWACFWSQTYRNLFKKELYFEQVIRKQKAKLIHAHFGTEGLAILPVKKRLKLPLVTTFYGLDMSQQAQSKEQQTAYKKLFSDGDLFLVEGNHMRKGLIDLGCPPDQIRILHIAVDINKIKYQKRQVENKDEKIKILFCGRLIEKKGLIYALKAIKLIVDKYPDLEFRVIGDGRLKSGIETFIKEQNLQKYVILLGYQPYHVFIEELKKAHILLQPSITAQDGDSEGGAPTVLLEAQASGLPVISTYHADIPEVVIDGKSGFLVPERSPEEIAEKLKLLISKPKIWQELGQSGRAHIEQNYNIDIEIKKLEDIYKQLIGKT